MISENPGRTTPACTGGTDVAVAAVAGSSPTVVFVSGMGEPGSNWKAVLPLLTSGAATVTYDRPGIDETPPRPAPNPPLPYSGFADELATMLDQVGVTGPAVLVGHSFGSLIARMFAATYPDRVAGMVHVDGSVPKLELWPVDGPSTDGSGPDATEIDPVTGEREITGATFPRVPGLVLVRTPGNWAVPLPDPAYDGIWQEAQVELASQLDVPLIVAADSGHRMAEDAPALVAFAVDKVVTAVRQRRTVVCVDPGRVAAVGGTPVVR